MQRIILWIRTSVAACCFYRTVTGPPSKILVRKDCGCTTSTLPSFFRKILTTDYYTAWQQVISTSGQLIQCVLLSKGKTCNNLVLPFNGGPALYELPCGRKGLAAMLCSSSQCCSLVKAKNPLYVVWWDTLKVQGSAAQFCSRYYFVLYCYGVF